MKYSERINSQCILPLKVIKFASNVIDSHLYNMLKDLEEVSTQKNQKQHK